MKKAFVWDPVMRSSARKYDPCILLERNKCKIKCDNCSITLIADRFLGKEFQREILGKIGGGRRRYPYAIIADGLGCNLRCWFCYAYKFLTKKSAESSGCHISYISPSELARQFGCKIEKMSNYDELLEIAQSKELTDKKCKGAVKHLQMKLPLMRIRISGGEPLFSNKNTIAESANPNPIKATIDYWLTFFMEFDRIVGILKNTNELNIIEKEKVKNKEWGGNLPFPTSLAERIGRLNIRFDTNGIIFANEETTRLFIGGLFSLFREKKVSNIFIEFDYSFKGATPIEYYWSQKQRLPVDPSKISFNYELNEHPQISGYFNILQIIKEYSSRENDFKNCVGITAERGINHNKSQRTYLNCIGSLNWESFANKTGISFSVVDNPIDTFNWRNWRPKSYYIKNGANLKIITDKEVFDLKQNPDLSEFKLFREEHPDSHFIIHPLMEEITLKKSKIRKRVLDISQTRLFESDNNKWLFSGTYENWIVAMKNRKWGIREGYRDSWRNLRKGDYALFYAMKPISRIIGFGKVKEIKEETSLLWPDEIRENKSKYPLRIIFDEFYFLSENDWKEGIKSYDLEKSHGINLIHDEEKFYGNLERLKKLLESS